MGSNVEHMGKNTSFAWLFVPLIVLVFLSIALFIERSGVAYDAQRPSLHFLEPMAITETASSQNGANSHADSLVLYDSDGVEGAAHYQTVFDTLDSMRVSYQSFDVNTGDVFNLRGYQTVVVAFVELNKIEDQILDLTTWVHDGGRVMFSIRPDPSHTFSAIYRKLGILSKADYLVTVNGVEFIDGLLPGTRGKILGEDWMFHSSIPVQLEGDAQVHLISADEYKLPLVWEYAYGSGRFVFNNTDIFTGKASRGMIGAAYSLLQDVFVYPAINSSMIFIGGFPGPIPEGENELISKQFGREIPSFFINVWWPDIQGFARKYRLEYTGLMVETYNDDVDPPFSREYEEERYQYFGALLLAGGGEIGLNGYNSIPLCLENVGSGPPSNTPAWPSSEAMQSSMDELANFSTSLFPEQTFTTYAPPSNRLCPQARQWLPMILPDLKVISSSYLPDDANPGFEQEFTEADDGMIELPKIVSGYVLDDYMLWAMLNELGLHYVNSHYIYPLDVLVEQDGAQKGWAYLRDVFDEYLLWLHTATPKMRNMTASEGAMAVQRFDRLGVSSGFDDNVTYAISLDHFYDEAWLLMRTTLAPESIAGGAITEVTSGLYLIEARQPEVVIRFGE